MSENMIRRINDIDVLQNVYKAFDEEHLEDSLSILLRHVIETTGAKYGGIYLVDRNAQALYLTANTEGRATQVQRYRKIPNWAGIDNLSYVIRTGEPYHINNLSVLTVPLKTNNYVYGVITLEDVDTNRFAEGDVGWLYTLANATAAAVRQVRLFQDLEEINRFSERLNAISVETVQDVWQIIQKSTVSLMDTNNLYIAFYDKYTDTLRFDLVYVNGERIDVAKNKRYQPRRSGAGKCEWIIRNRESLVFSTSAENAAWCEQIGQYADALESMASWIGVPMIAADEVLGVMATFHPSAERVYSPDNLIALQAIANKSAEVISKMRLTQRRRLRELAQFLSSNIYLTEKDLLEIIHQYASRLMHTDEMYISLYDRASDVIRFGLVIQNGESIDVETEASRWLSRLSDGRTEWIIQHRRPLFHLTREDSDTWYEEQKRKEQIGGTSTGSWLGVPMITNDDHVVGVLAVWHMTQDYAYTGYDLEILQTLAEIAANALAKTQRFREVQAYQELGTLGTAMAAVQHRINNTLNIVSPNVARLRKRVDPNDEETQQILDIIDRNVSYTSQIIHRIQNNLRGEEQIVNLNAILLNVANQASEEWQIKASNSETGVFTVLDLDEGIPLFKGPIGQIEEVFINLANNACRAMPNGGKLSLVSRFDGNTIFVRVIDTGSGIPDAILSRLFKRPVPAREISGAGLGLYLGALIIQSMGGGIEVEKTGPKWGTTMLVHFPLPSS